MIVNKYRSVVYVCGTAFVKILEWTHGEEPRIGEPCILKFGSHIREVRSDNVIPSGQNSLDPITTCFFQLDDEELFYYLCDDSNRNGWDELVQG